MTISIGGNDAKWADVLGECFFEASEESADDCFNGINTFPGTDTPLNEWVEHRLGVVVARIEATAWDLRATAPNATIVLVGYPQLTPGLDEEQRCGKFDPPFFGRKKITPTEQNKFRAYASQLDASLQDVADRVGIHYVSVAEAFAGHEVCGNGGEWINGLSLDGFGKSDRSFHPNRDGQRAYARTIEEYFERLRRQGWPFTDAGPPGEPGWRRRWARWRSILRRVRRSRRRRLPGARRPRRGRAGRDGLSR